MIHESSGHPHQDIVGPLYGAFHALEKGRIARGTLEIDGVEPYIIFDDKGFVKDLVHRERLDSHRLIEEFMILANVAAAETLEKAKMPCMYRIHDVPDLEKIEEVRRMLAHLKIKYSGPLKTPQDLTALLTSVKGTPHQTIVNELVLRSQSQAVYRPNNIGHFGLNLDHYAHFTSPIRRYADLLIHRSLLSILGYKEDGLPEGDGRNFEGYGVHISMAERRAQGAERDAMDRYMTHYLEGRVGEVFDVYVTGITKAGLFVNIAHLGASGLVPMRLMGDDYYVYKEFPTRLEGRRTRRVFSFGDPMRVKLLEADTTKGRLTFEPILDRAREGVKSSEAEKPFKKKSGFSRKKR
jgi:ribonuclease R